MRKEQIKKLYLWLGLINFIFSIVGYLLFLQNDSTERLSFLMTTNLGFHLFYWFIGFLPRPQIRAIIAQRRIPVITHSFATLFAWACIVIGLLVPLVILVPALRSPDPGFFAILTPTGIALGGFSLLNFLKGLKV